ncbi:hypothetical protein Q4540_13095 [Pseudoalteromonas carrageenovora]|uniref:hypothetical protein n=1 Tax=Pseudoalteromonas carrageenovora TaxID=227 RepID=UPI0026E36A03|nr:hypothetical protein [Pseudoalteromonas carrageenovora]MDO6637247.1 hypothetical protein [Pseudoalteromonas carrageenovora]MDO6649432.1 hypothetical protein [Pseudoalteromonas carrageenovora]
MNWNQFGYICRVYSSKTLSASQKAELTAQPHLAVYANERADSKLANDLAAKFALQDEATLQKQAVHYQCLPQLINEFKLEQKGLLSYLTIVFVIYVFSSFLYQFFVVPTFVEIYSNHTISLEHTFDDYFSYWYVPIILLLFLQSIIFTVTLKLKNACTLIEAQPFSGLFKVLIPSKLVNQYRFLVATLSFALNFKAHEKSSSPETKHLAKCDSLGYETDKEFKVLLEHQLKQFNSQVKSFINKLVILYGLVIVVSIYLFVRAAYQPIFMLGEVL